MKQHINLNTIIEKYWLLIFTVVFAIISGILQPAFFSTGNLANLFSTAILTAMAAAGLVCVQAVGELDFSTGAVMSWAASMICFLMHRHIVNSYVLAIVITLVSCLAFGLFNSFCHVVLGIPAFLATLASANVFRAVTSLLMDNTTIFKGNWNSDVFTFLGQHRFFNVIPVSLILFIIVAGIIIFILERTKIGKSMYFVGGNPTACQYVGINPKKYKLIAFLICSLLCGLAGILQASTANGGGANSGDAYQLQTILVCALGATFIKKGIPNVPGAFLGSILLTMIAQIIILIGLPTFWQYSVQGLVLVLAVLISARVRARNERS